MPAWRRTTLRFPCLSGPDTVTDRSLTWKRRTDPPKTSSTRPSKATMRFGPAATSSRSMTAKVPGASPTATDAGGVRTARRPGRLIRGCLDGVSAHAAGRVIPVAATLAEGRGELAGGTPARPARLTSSADGPRLPGR